MEKNGYIIWIYNKYEPWMRKHAVKTFEINEVWYAIYEIDNDMPFFIDKEFNLDEFYKYKSKEAAMLFVRQMKQLNR